MSSQIITGLWGPNFLGNHSVTKIASEHTSLWERSFNRQMVYTPVLNKKTLNPPPPTNNYDSTVHVFVSYTMVQTFALLISFH